MHGIFNTLECKHGISNKRKDIHKHRLKQGTKTKTKERIFKNLDWYTINIKQIIGFSKTMIGTINKARDFQES